MLDKRKRGGIGHAGFESEPHSHTENRNAMLFPPTAMGIRGFFASPSVVHFSISPTTCQGQAAKAVTAFAGIRWLVTSGSGNHLLVAVPSLTENLEHSPLLPCIARGNEGRGNDTPPLLYLPCLQILQFNLCHKHFCVCFHILPIWIAC